MTKWFYVLGFIGFVIQFAEFLILGCVLLISKWNLITRYPVILNFRVGTGRVLEKKFGTGRVLGSRQTLVATKAALVEHTLCTSRASLAVKIKMKSVCVVMSKLIYYLNKYGLQMSPSPMLLHASLDLQFPTTLNSLKPEHPVFLGTQSTPTSWQEVPSLNIGKLCLHKYNFWRKQFIFFPQLYLNSSGEQESFSLKKVPVSGFTNNSCSQDPFTTYSLLPWKKMFWTDAVRDLI